MTFLNHSSVLIGDGYRSQNGAGHSKKGGCVLCQGIIARYAFVNHWQGCYPIKLLCRTLRVSRAGFYAWLKRAPSKRTQENERIAVLIRAAHTKTRFSYGAKRLQAELAKEGLYVGRDRIARLRRAAGIHCLQKRAFKSTTQSNHNLPVAENLLAQKFMPTAPNQIWVSDITYIPTEEGWLYLAGIKDFFTCEIVGYAMGSRMTKELVSQALWAAVKWKRPAKGLILHSDRGSQYCAHAYRKLIDQFGLRCSMSRRGNCYDNAPMESFWGSMKNELVHHRHYETRLMAEASIREYIEIFYNRQRLLSRLGNMAPAVFVQNFRKQQACA